MRADMMHTERKTNFSLAIDAPQGLSIEQERIAVEVHELNLYYGGKRALNLPEVPARRRLEAIPRRSLPMPVKAAAPRHVPSGMERGYAGCSKSLRSRRPPLPDLPLREGSSLLASAGLEATHR